MRAVVYAGAGGPEVITLGEVPRPEVHPGHIRVRVRAAGLNRADLLQRRGNYPAPQGWPADIPGLEYAGEVEAVRGVTRWKVGDRVMGLVGGGAMAELLTVKRYWKQWSDPRLVILVLDNRDLNQVTWEMRAMEGDARYDASQDLPEMNYAAYADLLGLKGIRVERPNEVAAAWDIALSSDRPVVIDAIVDPDVPPLPPHITLEQSKAFLLSMLKTKGPERTGVIREAIGHMFPGLAPKT